MIYPARIELGEFKVLSTNPTYLYRQRITVRKHDSKPFDVDIVQHDKGFSCSLKMQDTEEYKTTLTLHKNEYHVKLIDCDAEMVVTGDKVLSVVKDFVEVPMVLNIPDCLVYNLYGQPIVLPYRENIKPTLLEGKIN